MRTIDYLLGPDREIFLPALAVACAVSVLSASLSVLVVLKRMSFIGQGVSHAAFGGVGVAAVLGVAYGSATGGSWLFLSIVAVFCILAAAWMSFMSSAARESEDTAIAVVLVASMALGAVLVHLAATRAPGMGAVPSFEDILFGSVLSVRWSDAIAAGIAAFFTALVLWLWRRPILMWAFDEPAAPAFGVRSAHIRLLVMTILAVGIVVSMKLAGVVLASALLVLPGASALRLSRRLGPVFIWSGVLAVLGAMGGLLAAFELDTQPGPTMVMALVVIYALCALWSVVRARRQNPLPEGGVGEGGTV